MKTLQGLPRSHRHRNALLRIGWLLLWIVIAAYIILMLTADWIVDAIYANVNPDEHREMPMSVPAVRAVSERQYVLGGRGEGLSCSIPSMLGPMFSFQPVSMQFRQACISHDYCYRHGAATYDYTQLDCDRQLQEDAFRLCKFVYSKNSQQLCQTQARKVLAGVRLGGAGSFRPDAARASCQDTGPCEYPDPTGVSTYFEYESHPRASGDFVVARLAPIPEHVTRGVLRVGLYYFVTRPAAVSVTVYGIEPDGAVRRQPDLARQVRGSSRYLSAPPQVVGEKFFWWRRASHDNTAGSPYTLDPLTATEADWRDVFEVPDSECVSAPCDPETLQMLPTSLDAAGGLVGLTTHSCGSFGGTLSEPCLVARGSGAPLRMWPVRSEYFDQLKHKDRYRSLALAPWLSSNETNGTVLWFARRDEIGDSSASTDISLFGVTLSPPVTDTMPLFPHVVRYRGWTEADEPFVARGERDPVLVSLRRSVSAPRDPMSVRIHRGASEHSVASCANLSGDWLDIPPVFLGEDLDTVVFQRVLLPKVGDPEDAPARIELVRVALTEECIVAGRGDWTVPRTVLDDYAGIEKSGNKAKIASLLLGQMIVSNVDDDPRLDIIATQPGAGRRTLIRMNLL